MDLQWLRGGGVKEQVVPGKNQYTQGCDFCEKAAFVLTLNEFV